MEKYTYIKLGIKGVYITFDEKFDETLYDNLGSTYQDYLDKKWILLSDEQVAFHEENPTATVKEVLNMELTPKQERTLNRAKQEMLNAIINYDSSSEVNSFILNDTISYWFTPEERANYNSSISAAKLVGKDTLTFCIGSSVFTVPTEDAEKMLAQIQLYADECYIITSMHKSNVNNLKTIEEVDTYDYTSNYPDKLQFTIE